MRDDEAAPGTVAGLGYGTLGIVESADGIEPNHFEQPVPLVGLVEPEEGVVDQTTIVGSEESATPLE